MTSVQSLDDLEFLTIEKPKMLIKEGLQKEKQISVDPISMNDSKSPSSPLPPIIKSPTANGLVRQPPPLVPTKYKFLSSSLPNSASTSPRINSAFMKSKGKIQNQVSSPSNSSLARQHSVALTRLAQLRESHLKRSKSCGEGRASAPTDDFDLWLTNVNSSGHNSPRQNNTSCAVESNKIYSHNKSGKEMYKSYDEEFKCGALCLYLPGFGKGKPVRARKEELEMTHVVSRTVSLEKFECGSWTSSAIINDHDHDADGDSSNLYFDLPLELIRTSVNDANSPVSSAFVFDKDRKGVLKNGTSKGAAGRKSCESSRHVRFSTSSPTAYPTSPSSACITPRLRKAREDFNAFIEAQSA